MEYNISKAARIMRAGDQLSETNKKLREAVYSFIEWIFQAIDGHQLPGEGFGWVFERDWKTNKIQVMFRVNVGKWRIVTANSEKTYMEEIFLFCQALAGKEGGELLTWMEKQTKERNQFFEAVQSGIEVFRSSLKKGS
jgi:hypothetical protein